MLTPWRNIFFWFLPSLFSLSIFILGSLPPPCDNLIYCHGPLLRTVQLANLGGDFIDSKYFVDMTLINTPGRTLVKFTKLMNNTHNKPSRSQVGQFVKENFLKPNTEFTTWIPDDWISSPSFLNNISDRDLKKWGSDLNDIWKDLGRKISTTVQEKQNKHSLIYLSHPFIVPGGRFRETYYWDSYWTIEGLLLSEMKTTVKGMLENFMELVKTYGMVPNGNRIYYTRRSQPPFLIPMAKLYLDATNDISFIRENIFLLETEFKFWLSERTVPVRDKSGKVHQVAQYNVQVGGPRPEAYKEDYHLAQNLSTNDEKEELYIQFKSGAESGWDYSTRWFVNGNSNKGDLSDINVTAIAPVDLNSLLCYNARLLSEMYDLIGNSSKSAEYLDKAADINNTLADLFWDETDGIWYDVNIHTGQKRRFFYLSNIHPLWTGCFGGERSSNQKNTFGKVIDYLLLEQVDEYIGGIPTSLRNSGQQWDYPNAWAPLQHLAIMGLHNNKDLHEEAESLAMELAQKWISNNYQGYKKTQMAHLKESATAKGAMFEKYDVNRLGIAGAGGEYEVVSGFGWTNGVAMSLLNTFGDQLSSKVAVGASSRVTSQPSLAVAIIFMTYLLRYINL